MKVKIPHDLRNFVHWFFIRTICAKAKETEGTNGNFQKVPGWEELEGINIDIKLIINGVECDFVKTVMSLDEQLDGMILEKAKELVEDKFKAINEVVYRMEQTAVDGVRKIADTMGVKLREERY